MANQASNNFWNQSKEPLFMLAPMEDVTDTAFRELVLRNAAADSLHVLFTEFTSTDGMCHPVGRTKVSHRLMVSEGERRLLDEKKVKLVAQIWGNKPEKFRETIRYICDNYQFDGIDINMGCPVKNVVQHGSCSALINNESLAAEIIEASREASNLPLSVKTRLGVKTIDTERWLTFLLKQPIDAIILHGRIQKQMSEGIANWEEIAKAVAIRNAIAPHVKMIGNGDIESVADGLTKIKTFGTDGVMVGRGIFKNPWFFSPEREIIEIAERFDALLMHLFLFEKNWGKTKNFAMLKRFFKIYLSDFDGASDARQQMMETTSYLEATVLARSLQNK
jgi:tRNA-dihydrouridine synthase